MKKELLGSVMAEVFEEIAQGLENPGFRKKTRVGLTLWGSEHGPEELARGGELAQKANPDLEVVLLGRRVETSLEILEAGDEKAAHELMDQLLENRSLDAAVTMHYSFPIGVATVGRVVTPARGKEMFLATTTGTAATEQAAAMFKNTIYGIAVAKACGNPAPTVGILNIGGARQLERALTALKDKGYPLELAESARSEGGIVMRGNDLLLGGPDIMVQDSLTGNVLMKMFSAYTSGGAYETSGFGYGPGVGEDFRRIICIISRASGAPVVAGAVRLAADCARGNLPEKVKAELTLARQCGWDNLLAGLSPGKRQVNGEEEVPAPPKKPVTYSLPGIEVMELESAVQSLWKETIYAESGMGCTGPIVLIAEEDREKALEILRKQRFL